MDIKLTLSNTEHKDLISYCNLNDLLISDVVSKSFIKGFNIEKYGLLGEESKTIEVIKEIPVEKIVEVIREVPIEKVIEVIREVPVEKVVEVIREVPIEKVVEVIREVPIEKVVEIVKEVTSPPIEVKVVEYVDREVIIEVPVEKIVEKIVNIYDNSQIDELIGKTEQLKQENELFSNKVADLESQVEVVANKKFEMENIFQNEKKELLLKIQQLEDRKPDVVEKVIHDDTKQKMLEQTLQTLRTDLINKDKKIKELEDIVSSFDRLKQNIGAAYLNGSNLDKTMFK
jgi:hypothetical protein